VLADQLLLHLLEDLLAGAFGDDRLRGDAVRSHTVRPACSATPLVSSSTPALAARRRLPRSGRVDWHAGVVLLALIPKVFYADIAVGLDLFVDGIGMEILYRDDDLVVLSKDRAKLYLVQDAEYAAKDRPELSIETDEIDAIHADIRARRPDLLHPSLSQVRRQPWGPREFALLDSTTVCVVFRDWTTDGDAVP